MGLYDEGWGYRLIRSERWVILLVRVYIFINFGILNQTGVYIHYVVAIWEMTIKSTKSVKHKP